MPIRFQCPLGHRLIVPDERAGKKGKCPVCRQRVVIPHASELPAESLPFSANPNVISIRFPPVQDRFEPGERVVEDFDPDMDLPPRADGLLPPPGSLGPPLPTEPLTDPGMDLSRPPVPFMRLHQELPSERPTHTEIEPPPPPPPPYTPPSAVAAPPPAPATDPFQPVPNWGSEPRVTAPPPAPTPAFTPAPALNVPAPPPPAIPPVAAVVAAPVADIPAARDIRPAPPPPPDIYEPEPHRVQTVYMLAVGLAIVTLFSILPALKHLNLADAPGWARIVLLVAALQLLYVAWMVSLPDWSTVWIGMIVFASVSALYAAGMCVALFTPVDQPLVLGLTDLRRSAAGWCLAVILLMGFMTFLCGRIASQWRKAYELAKARKARG